MLTPILSFDLWFENIMLALRAPWGLKVFELITFFGNTTTVIGSAGLIGVYLVFSDYHRYRAYVLGLATSLLGAATSSYLLKEIVQRARPDGLVQAITETGYSLPSWHAVSSVVLYGFIAFLLSRSYTEHRKIVFTITAISIGLIGFSRLYLGVHFPSDVVAGYLVGGLWLVVGIALTKRLQDARQN